MTGVALVGAATLTPGVRRFVQHLIARGRGGLGGGELKAAAHLGRRGGKGRDVVGLVRLGIRGGAAQGTSCWNSKHATCCMSTVAVVVATKALLQIGLRHCLVQNGKAVDAPEACQQGVFLSDAGCSSFCKECWRPHWLPLPPCVMNPNPTNSEP